MARRRRGVSFGKQLPPQAFLLLGLRLPIADAFFAFDRPTIHVLPAGRAAIDSLIDGGAIVFIIFPLATMSSDRPLSVAERIAALQKSASNNNSSTSSSSPAGEGVHVQQVGGGKKKVSALAGDLSAKLNMNALLVGGSMGGGGVGAKHRQVKAPTMPTKPNGDNEITKRGGMCHPPRAMIPPGRRRRRGER